MRELRNVMDVDVVPNVKKQIGASDDWSFTLATWNIERPPIRGWKRLPAIRSAMDQVDADIWILTESRVPIAPRPGYFAVHSTPHPERLRDADERWVSVWSRWPCRSIELRTTPWAAAALIEPPGRQLIVYGTVLPYRNEPGPTGTPGPVWSQFLRELAGQAQGWRLLCNEYPSIPMAVAGDFNQSLDGSGWYESRETKRRLCEALRGAGLSCVTTEDVVESGKLQEDHLVDHVAVSQELSPNSVTCWERHSADGIRLSDHPGIVVGLRRLERPAE